MFCHRSRLVDCRDQPDIHSFRSVTLILFAGKSCLLGAGPLQRRHYSSERRLLKMEFCCAFVGVKKVQLGRREQAPGRVAEIIELFVLPNEADKQL